MKNNIFNLFFLFWHFSCILLYQLKYKERKMEKMKNLDEIYGCLPFVELASETIIKMGPVSFWPASQLLEQMNLENSSIFKEYLQSIAKIKATSEKEEQKSNRFIHTATLDIKEMTFVLISAEVPKEQKDLAVIDSIYLLHFACTFRNLYYGNEILSFEPFKKMVPASIDFISSKSNWQHLHLLESKREASVCIHLFDQEIYQGLGKALAAIYIQKNFLHIETIDHYQCLIRSIRYLVDRSGKKFINLIDKGLHFSQRLFEPEEILFLSASFESLFNISETRSAEDFKHKLRPMLHLKYSKPVEIFWSWVDDFYALKRAVVHQGSSPSPLFKQNPNFEISHVTLGIKLFVYAVYYKLFEYKLITPIHSNHYAPPDFKWVHPEEILLFFWTESSLLKKLNIFIKRAQANQDDSELLIEISLLCDLYLSMYERYYLHPNQDFVHFHPSPLSQTKGDILQILEVIEQQKEKMKKNLLATIPKNLIAILKDRLSEN